MKKILMIIPLIAGAIINCFGFHPIGTVFILLSIILLFKYYLLLKRSKTPHTAEDEGSKSSIDK